MKTKEFKLPKEFTERWITALRSGVYVQDTEHATYRHDGCYCVVGVAGVANDLEFKSDNHIDIDGHDINGFLGSALFRKLYSMNDLDKKPFPEIADWIETNVTLI